MNKIIIYLLAIITMVNSCSSCKKDTLDSNGLPAATQTGANTFGFLLNGQPWTPQGNNGTANLSIDVDFGFNNGIFTISSYKIVNNNSNSKQTFGVGISDSLNFITSYPKTFTITKNGVLGFSFLQRNGCSFDYFDTTITRTGSLTITKLDKTNRIIAGTFNAILSQQNCDTVKITEGRFDMKF